MCSDCAASCHVSYKIFSYSIPLHCQLGTPNTPESVDSRSPQLCVMHHCLLVSHLSVVVLL